MKPKLTPKGMFSKQAINTGDIISGLPPDLSLSKQHTFRPTQKKSAPIKSITHMKPGTRNHELAITHDSPSRKSPRSEKLPIELMTYDELAYILDRNRLPFLTGNDTLSKKQNYLSRKGRSYSR